jgi:16S rRNA (guanine527-N7)-methyltransferase
VSNDFLAEARLLGFDLSSQTAEGFRTYRDAMLAAAAEFSLTAVRDASGIERRHFLESLALARVLIDAGILPSGIRVLDIGSGAGLPGLPLKLVRPDLQLGLLEANGKKCRFLREMVALLNLEGVAVLEARAEELGRDLDQRGSYDLVLARAVASLPVLLEYALPLLKLGGRLAATKGSGVAAEVEAAGPALRELGGQIVERLPLHPPGGQRQEVVLVRKVAETPQRFPRRSGMPVKRPIG